MKRRNLVFDHTHTHLVKLTMSTSHNFFMTKFRPALYYTVPRDMQIETMVINPNFRLVTQPVENHQANLAN